MHKFGFTAGDLGVCPVAPGSVQVDCQVLARFLRFLTNDLHLADDFWLQSHRREVGVLDEQMPDSLFAHWTAVERELFIEALSNDEVRRA